MSMGRRSREQDSVGRGHAGAQQSRAEQVAIAVANRERRIDRDRARTLEFGEAAQRALALAHREDYFRVGSRGARGKCFRVEGLGLDTMRRQLGEDRIEDGGVGLDLARRKFHFAINYQSHDASSPYLHRDARGRKIRGLINVDHIGELDRAESYPLVDQHAQKSTQRGKLSAPRVISECENRSRQQIDARRH